MTPPRTSLTILMADDDADDRLMAQEAFEEARLANELHFVENGEALMDYLYRRGPYAERSAAQEPRLILLDLNMPKKDGREEPIEPTVTRLMPPDIALKHQVMPIAKTESTLSVAVADPTTIVVDELKVMTGLSITLMIAAERVLRELIDRVYDASVPLHTVVLLVDDDRDDHLLTQDLLIEVEGQSITFE